MNPVDLTRLASTALASSAALDDAVHAAEQVARPPAGALGGGDGAAAVGRAAGRLVDGLGDTVGILRQLLEDDADALTAAALAYRRVQDDAEASAGVLAADVAAAPEIPRPGARP